LSQHLTLLRAQHLVDVRKQGRESFYSLADDSIAVAIRSIHDFLRKTHRIDVPFDSKALFPIVTDPICGMRLSASKTFSHIEHDGKLYHFCASGCETAFIASLKGPLQNILPG
jgi:YHS domain-containing protein